MSAEEEQSTGIFNSLMFHTNSAVDFGFPGTSDTVSDVSVTMPVTVWDGITFVAKVSVTVWVERVVPNFYPYTLQHSF